MKLIGFFYEVVRYCSSLVWLQTEHSVLLPLLTGIYWGNEEQSCFPSVVLFSKLRYPVTLPTYWILFLYLSHHSDEFWKWILNLLFFRFLHIFSEICLNLTATWELFPAKCHERATIRKLWRQTGNSSLLPSKCWPLLHIIWLIVFHRFEPFALLYNKSLNDWSLGEQWTLFPENLNVSRDEVEGNIEILQVWCKWKQISAFQKKRSL